MSLIALLLIFAAVQAKSLLPPCPPGFQNADGSCRIQLEAFPPSCPPGFTDKDGNCTVQPVTTPACRMGYELVDGVCKFFCPPGFERDDGSCPIHPVTKADPCPPGFINPDGSCNVGIIAEKNQ